MAGNGRGSAYERTFLGIAITVTVVWAVATLAQVVDPHHLVPDSVNYVMGIVATGFFGGALIAGRRNGNGNGSGRRDEVEGDRRVRSLREEAIERGKKLRPRGDDE